MRPILPISVLFISFPFLNAQTGTISGFVRDEAGRGVAKAEVGLRIRPIPLTPASPLPPAPRPYNASAISGGDGGFSFASVPEGVYILCGHVDNSDLINPCAWFADKDLVVVRAGKTTTSNLVLNKGHRLRVRLNDPTGRLTALDTRPGEKMQLTIGPTSSSFVFLPVSSAQANAREHSILVPFDADLSLRVFSRTFQLADNANAAIDATNGRAIPVRVAKGSSPAPIVLKVTGVQPGAR